MWNDIWERIKQMVRQPEFLGSLATLIVLVLRQFVPAVADVISFEIILAMLGLLLGVPLSVRAYRHFK